MRTKKVFWNSITSIIGQVIHLVVSLIAQAIFVKVLGDTYLGINSLFTQIMSMLSLMELGVGSAIVFSLYKPLTDKNYDQVAAIMNLYRKIYTYIGLGIAVLGLALTPFIQYFTKEHIDYLNLKIVLILFTANTSLSYFFIYKQNLIIADQDKYISNINHYLFLTLCNIAQIFILIKTRNYYFYLITNLIFTFSSNLCISMIANKRYPFLKKKCQTKVDKDTTEIIKKNTKALIYHKIGDVGVNATDSLIISKFIGVAANGVNAKYLLVTNAINSILNQVFASFTASIGNYSITKSKDKLLELFYTVNYLGFVVVTVVSITAFTVFNDFIHIVYPSSNTFGTWTVFVKIMVFYFSGMRLTIGTFKSATGLFWEDRYRPILESAINIISSIILLHYFGIDGVFYGTIISNLCCNLVIEPYVLYHYRFFTSSVKYYQRYFIYVLISLVTGILVTSITSRIAASGLIMWIVKALVTFILSGLLVTLPFMKTKEYQALKNKALLLVKHRSKAI